MARIPRLNAEGQPHHVVQRGNNRQKIFFKKADYEYFLSLLRDFSTAFACEVHTYVLMTNHIHLLVTPRRKDGVSKLMQFIGRRYVRYINKTYKRTGSLWEGRYKSSIIDSDQYLLTCMRYIELNPVRARMVKNPEKYEWSSYKQNANGAASDILTPHDIYTALSASPAKRLSSYRALFNNNADEDEFNDIRMALKGGWVVGSDAFKKKIGKKLQGRVSPLPRGGDRRSGKVKVVK